VGISYCQAAGIGADEDTGDDVSQDQGQSETTSDNAANERRYENKCYVSGYAHTAILRHDATDP
jgi:hypothetical protein